jgi:flagellar basal body-associated protein FliL
MENKKLKILILVITIVLLIIGGYFGINLYLTNKQNTIPDQQVQGELDYGTDSKANVDAKPFITALPYHATDYDVYYSSINDEVQIIMKNKGLSFADAKNADEADVNKFLQNIGVDLNKVKVVWLLQL